MTDDEPSTWDWREVADADLAAVVLSVAAPRGRVPVVGIDGRSASGKTTLAGRLAELLVPAAVVHTDDIAWWHSHFDWPDVLLDDVLVPLLSGADVRAYRPPGWVARGRDGHLDYPADVSVILVEGVGVAQARLRPHLDIAIWVASDREVATARGLARDTARLGSREAAMSDWDDWMAAEEPFLAHDRPWTRVDLVVGGTGLHDDRDPHVLRVAGPA